MRIIFVCTGNVFRSPMAQSYLGAMVRDRKLDIVASSCGTLPGERPMSENARQVVGTDGIDMSEHTSRPLDPQDLQRADLIIGMEREHVRETVLVEPSVWDRTFTLKEFVRRGEAVGPRADNQTLDEWLGKLGQGRTREDLLGWSTEDDVEDPMDQGGAVYRATGREIRDLVERLLALIEPAW